LIDSERDLKRDGVIKFGWIVDEGDGVNVDFRSHEQLLI